ncbi:EamA family transporter [Luteibacter aegosomatissinici]|uniref:EamA family transporter n=1 Tax=Luteibacter aegosomatissinici TaxID=2911539 RepID=UPI001FFA34EF|nr:EamA family transporter [Luteibacter aegosomatissinici]UPG94916.1 EamA family transporter [Luteibacter aegosomatissinici]
MRPFHILLGVLVTLIWGSNFSVIEVGLGALDPFVLTTLRFALTAVPLVFFVRRPVGVPLAAMAAYGLLFGAGLWGVVNIAMAQGMSPGLSSLVLQFAAFMTVVLSAMVFREPIRAPQVTGMLLGTAGLIVVIRAAPGTSTLVGTSLILLAAFNWSLCNLLVKRFRPPDMLAFVVWTSAFAVPALVVLTLVAKGPAAFATLPATLTWAAVGSVLFQAYITTIFGYAVWNFLMKTYPASSVAPLSLLVPVSGIATSWLAFGERFPPALWLGVLLILLGIGVFIVSPLLRKPTAA